MQLSCGAFNRKWCRWLVVKLEAARIVTLLPPIGGSSFGVKKEIQTNDALRAQSSGSSLPGLAAETTNPLARSISFSFGGRIMKVEEATKESGGVKTLGGQDNCDSGTKLRIGSVGKKNVEAPKAPARVTKADGQEDSDEVGKDFVCGLCRDHTQDGDLAKVQDCGHKFCVDCIIKEAIQMRCCPHCKR